MKSSSMFPTMSSFPGLKGPTAPPSSLYWTRDGQGTAGDRTDVASVGESLYTLQHSLAEVTRQDAGRYSCHVITSYDSVRSRPAMVKVRAASRILGQPQTQTVMEGDSAQFR